MVPVGVTIIDLITCFCGNMRTRLGARVLHADLQGTFDQISFHFLPQGSVVASADEKLIQQISQGYPGRATMAPVMDLFITLLSMGQKGWMSLLQNRSKLCSETVRATVISIAANHHLAILQREELEDVFAEIKGNRRFGNDSIVCPLLRMNHMLVPNYLPELNISLGRGKSSSNT